jgi:hypothetical protein
MADDPKDPPAPPAKDDTDDDLGDGGKKALDAERAARRKAEKDAKDLAARLQALEDKDKSELDKLRDENTQLKTQLDTATTQALRLEVAAEKGVKARWLSGTTREELEAAADEYLEDHPPAKDAGPVPGKPATDLKGGGDPTEDPDVDVRKVVESIPRGI